MYSKAPGGAPVAVPVVITSGSNTQAKSLATAISQVAPFVPPASGQNAPGFTFQPNFAPLQALSGVGVVPPSQAPGTAPPVVINPTPLPSPFPSPTPGSFGSGTTPSAPPGTFGSPGPAPSAPPGILGSGPTGVDPLLGFLALVFVADKLRL